MKLPLRLLQNTHGFVAKVNTLPLTAVLINKQATNNFHLAVSAVEKKMEK